MKFKLTNYKKVFFFDFDDNIIWMPNSFIHVFKNNNWQLKEELVNTKDYGNFLWEHIQRWDIYTSKDRNDIPKWYNYYIILNESYIEFRDDNILENQINEIVELDDNVFLDLLWLSFPSFLEAIINDEDFFIVTARWQSPNVMKEAILKILSKFIEIAYRFDNIYLKNNKTFSLEKFKLFLSDKLEKNYSDISYQDMINYFDYILSKTNYWFFKVIPSTNVEVLKMFWINQTANPEKWRIIKTILNTILKTDWINVNYSIGFSDDVLKNIEKVENNIVPFFQEKSKEWYNISLYLFNIKENEEIIKTIHF